MAIHTVYCEQQKIKVRINMLMSFIITCNCTPSNFWEIFADLALQMLQKQSTLALVRNRNNETGLHILARKPSDLSKSLQSPC